MKCCVARKTILLNEDHIRARLNYVDQFIDYPESFWANVVFTDEKPLQNYFNGRTFYRRSKDEDSNDPKFRVISDKSGRFKINLWGYMSSKGCGIYKINNSMDRFEYLAVIREVLPKINDLHNGNFIWLQDNCRPHNHDIINSYLGTKKINKINFPPRSPDLNMIEMFWALLQRNVNRIMLQKGRQATSKEDLFEICKKAMNRIKPSHCLKIISLVKRRLQMVKKV